MNFMNGLVGTSAVAALVAIAGCAAQSAEFRQMSASDHENAMRNTSDPALAQEHLEAAKRLRYEEQVACEGVPDADRIDGPFARSSRVTSIVVVREHGSFPKGFLEPVGITVDLKAEPGMTQQWLGRVIACHIAHVAVVGHIDHPSPLSVTNSQVSVSSTAVGFRVTVTSKNPEIARSVVQRGQELAESTFGPASPIAMSIASSR